MSRARICLPACGACWRWWVRRLRATTDASRSNCRRVGKCAPQPWNVRRRPSAATSRGASRHTWTAPCNWICRPSWENPFPSGRCRGTAPEYPWSKKRPRAGPAKWTDNPPTRARASGAAPSPRRSGRRKARRSAIRTPRPLPARSRPPASSASGSIWKPGIAAGAARKRRSGGETAPRGSGTLPASIFPAPFRSSICFMPPRTAGIWRDASTPATTSDRNKGGYVTSPNSMTATSKSWSAFSAPSTRPRRNWPKRSEAKPTPLRTTPHACATPSSAAHTGSPGPA
jgi:hypothetical protein